MGTDAGAGSDATVQGPVETAGAVPVPVAVPVSITEQGTAAGRAIEHDSFAIIDAEVGVHGYSAEQWPVVRRMIHASADFDLNGLTAFHPRAIEAALAALAQRPAAGGAADMRLDADRGPAPAPERSPAVTPDRNPGRPLIADVGMIPAGLSPARLTRFGLRPRQFIADADVIAAARAQGTTRAVQAMRKAWRLGLLDGAVIGIGNAPTALIELVRLIEQADVRPALVLGMPVGFVAAAESKELLAGVDSVPWIIVRGRKGGSTLVVAAVHALLALADAEQARNGG